MIKVLLSDMLVRHGLIMADCLLCLAELSQASRMIAIKPWVIEVEVCLLDTKREMGFNWQASISD